MATTYEQLIQDMTACEQTKGMTVLEHGQLVHAYYTDLIAHLRTGSPLSYQWRVPEWVYTLKDRLLGEILDDQTMERYLVHHDCGKPYCRTVDENGKQHFPDHAKVSYEVWSTLFPEETTVAELIRLDMMIHTVKAEQVPEFAGHPFSASLILAGLSEVHANASMFGGLQSDSFKIKFKQIEKRGRQILTFK